MDKEYINYKNIKNYHKGDFGNEGIILFPLFNKEITFYVDFEIDIDTAQKCVEFITNLSNEMLEHLCNGSIAYCEDERKFFEQLGIEIPTNISGKDILKYITPISLSLTLSYPKTDKIVIHLDCDCDWEEEHGLEWIITEDKVLYIGPFIGKYGYNDEESYSSEFSNYAN